MEKFKFLEHTADIKFQAFGKTREEVFENSAYALKEVTCKTDVQGKIKKNFEIQIEGTDLAGALRGFLEEFLFKFDSEGFVLSNIEKIKIKEKSGTYFIDCLVSGDDAKNYEIGSHVKAITYNEMFIKEENGTWISQVVLDI